MTGRQYILGEVEKHLGGRVATGSITPTKNDITFLRAKLEEDTMPEEIIKNIPETVSEMQVGKETLLKIPKTMC